MATASTADTLLLVGTVKGLFRFASDDRRTWRPLGASFGGTRIDATAQDPATGRLYAAFNSEWYGPGVRRSDDGGETWDSGGGPIAYASDDPEKVSRVWSLLAPGDGTVYAGVEASGLFVSRDGGDTWSEVSALRGHPTHDMWGAGYGGKCLHTLAVDPFEPSRLMVAASTGGVYRSEDRGASWAPSNQGIRADFLPEEQRYPIAGQCVHRFAFSAAQPGRMWLQNHGGVFRSDDSGRQWIDVGASLPSDFGFPVVGHPRRADTAFVVPLDGMERWVPGNQLRVFRTDDAGASWQPVGPGLPDAVYNGVLRGAMTRDDADPLGLYFGTTGGEVFASADEAATWTQVASHLPRVLSVTAVGPRA